MNGFSCQITAINWFGCFHNTRRSVYRTITCLREPDILWSFRIFSWWKNIIYTSASFQWQWSDNYIQILTCWHYWGLFQEVAMFVKPRSVHVCLSTDNKYYRNINCNSLSYFDVFFCTDAPPISMTLNARCHQLYIHHWISCLIPVKPRRGNQSHHSPRLLVQVGIM